MVFLILVAYVLPIFVLMALIGRAGKKFVIYLFWGFLSSIPAYYLFKAVTSALPDLLVPGITVSPLIEEFFKALPILIPAFIGLRNHNDDVLVYAMASGIGFSLVETWVTINPASLQLSLGTFLSVSARSFSTSLMHGCTCGIVGYGIYLIRNFDRKALPALLFGFYTVAVTIHAMYNLLLTNYYRGVGGEIVDIVFPIVLLFLLLTCYRVDLPGLFKRTAAQ